MITGEREREEEGWDKGKEREEGRREEEIKGGRVRGLEKQEAEGGRHKERRMKRGREREHNKLVNKNQKTLQTNYRDS